MKFEIYFLFLAFVSGEWVHILFISFKIENKIFISTWIENMLPVVLQNVQSAKVILDWRRSINVSQRALKRIKETTKCTLASMAQYLLHLVKARCTSIPFV